MGDYLSYPLILSCQNPMSAYIFIGVRGAKEEKFLSFAQVKDFQSNGDRVVHA